MKQVLLLIVSLQFSFVGSAQFSKITNAAGISHFYKMLEFVGAGAVFFDLNNDGWEDLFLAGGNEKDLLLLNDTKGGFQDISYKLPYNNNTSTVSGAVAADIDNDGCTDLILTTLIRLLPNLYLRNDCEGNLVNMTETSNFTKKGRSIGAAVIDYDLDGDLDVYVANYVDTTRFIFDPNSGAVIGYDHVCYPNFFYENIGDNSFVESSIELGVEGEGCTLAVLSYFTEKKEPAVYVANDFGEYIKPNELFVKPDSLDVFLDKAPALGLDSGLFGMGIAIGDMGNDLDNDFYVTNLGANVLLENIDGYYFDRAEHYNVTNTYVSEPLLATSWGTFFFDVENDSDLDLFVANGYIPSADFIPGALRDPNKLYIWTEDQSFEDKTVEFNLDLESSNRGCLYSDYDHDGDLDILVTTVVRNENIKPDIQAEFFRNENQNEYTYLKILLEGVTNNRDGFGADVYAYLNTGKVLMRTLYSGGTHSSQSSKLIHFGLGEASLIDSIHVDWPNGVQDWIYEVPVNNNIFIQEGNANFEILGCMDPSAANYNPMATINYACKEGTSSIEDLITDRISIRTDGSNVFIISEVNSVLKYSILSLLGENLSSRQELLTTDEYTKIDVSYLIPGAYHILIEDGNQRKAFPFVIF
jgi:hypothetical protein